MDRERTVADAVLAGLKPETSTTLAARVRSFEWSRTPLGPMGDWPLSLRTAVGICLNSPVSMAIWWGPGLTLIYNDSFAPVLGQRHPDALGRSSRDVWSDMWPDVGPLVEPVLDGGQSAPRERQRYSFGREDRAFTFSFSPIPDDGGGVGGVLTICQEVTAQVEADGRARTILESITDAFFALDRDWRFTYLNPQAQRVLDLTLDLTLGVSIWDVYPGLSDSEFGRSYRRTVAEQVATSFASYYPDHDRWYEVHAYPAPGGGLSVYFRDITDRRRADAALTESTTLLAAISDATGDVIYAKDRRGRMRYANPATLGLIGKPLEQVMGRTDAEFLDDPDAASEVMANDRRVMDGGVPVDVEEVVPLPDGTRRVWLSRKMPDRDLAGQVTGLLGVSRDVTEQKAVAAEREALYERERVARADAERAGRMKDEFLATLSHELRTPLNAILGWATIIRGNNNDPEDVAQGLEVIERNARAQSQIIEDLLDMSRIISGKVRLDVQRLSLADIVQAAVATARPTAEAKGVRLTAVIDPLHGAVVNGDANRLQQVLWNLLSNAVKFTPKGGRVQVLLERVNSHVEISVSDSGEGIPPEFLPHVFDRFRQADASTTRRHGGLGLGLSIVKQLVELHGGAVRVKSAGRGRGTTFMVALPLTVVHPEEVPEPERRHPKAAPTLDRMPISCLKLDGVRVLVIDDEPDARALVQRVLEDCRAVVTSTGSVDEVVRLVATQQFDVLVSDIGMPVEDGYSLIRRVRALGRHQGGDIPSIALTAYARPEDRVKAVAAGFLMHVAKPVEPVELVTMVAGAAGRTGRD